MTNLKHIQCRKKKNVFFNLWLRLISKDTGSPLPMVKRNESAYGNEPKRFTVSREDGRTITETRWPICDNNSKTKNTTTNRQQHSKSNQNKQQPNTHEKNQLPSAAKRVPKRGETGKPSHAQSILPTNLSHSITHHAHKTGSSSKYRSHHSSGDSQNPIGWLWQPWSQGVNMAALAAPPSWANSPGEGFLATRVTGLQGKFLTTPFS